MNENMIPNTPPMNAPQSKSNLPIIIGIMAVLAIAVFFVLQMSASRRTPQQPTTETGILETEDAVIMDHTLPASQGQGTGDEIVSEASAVAIEVEGGDYYFDPNVIRVKRGATVTVTLNSVGMMHDFVIDELNVQSAVIPAGRSTTVTFIADQVGEFEFYCSVSDHRQMGMVGTLIVEE